jgi:hypothetical protein
MPSPAFTLSVPTDEPFRSLVVEAIRVYLRVSGSGTSPAADAFAALVGEAVDRLAAGGADIDVVVVATSPRVDVQLTCGGASETLTHTLAAAGG